MDLLAASLSEAYGSHARISCVPFVMCHHLEEHPDHEKSLSLKRSSSYSTSGLQTTTFWKTLQHFSRRFPCLCSVSDTSLSGLNSPFCIPEGLESFGETFNVLKSRTLKVKVDNALCMRDVISVFLTWSNFLCLPSMSC